MNCMHPTLKFTYEASETQITYLDLTIFKGSRFRESGILDTKVYIKPTETYQYLEKSSAHPPHVFNAFIKGETLRYARNTNNEGDFLEKVHTLMEKLLDRGYKKQKVLEIIRKIDFSQWENMIHKTTNKKGMKAPLVCTTTYNLYIKPREIKKKSPINTGLQYKATHCYRKFVRGPD